tara:strand:+ start:459 stop:869 length:411 start_codon:yes stop_codon:yes gene_type:complete
MNIKYSMKILNNQIIKNPKGDIIKIISKMNFNKSFKELYITSINYGDIKAWKKHKKTNLYLMILNGKIKLVTKFKNETACKIFNKNLKILIKIEKNTIFGFKGLSKYKSNILVISDLYHNKSEVNNFSLNQFNYKW